MSERAMAAMLCIAALVVSGGGVAAAEFRAAVGHKSYGRCHMDICSFFIVDRATAIGDGRNGTLFEIEGRDWSAAYRPPNEHDPENYDEYAQAPTSISKQEPREAFVYCSKTRPTMFDRIDGKWVSTPLRAGDDGAVFGFNEGAYMWYFAACHDAIVREPNHNHLAERLGYRFKQSHGGGKQGNMAPRDMLK